MRKELSMIVIMLSIISILVVYQRNNSKLDNSQNIDYKLGDTSSTPQLITPYYNVNHSIVADYALSSNGNDMTNTIQSALNNCSKNGGGTVWLEKGIYKVSSSIIIPSMCTLMGDWQDPDNYQGTLDYGTKIVVDVNTFKIDNNDLENTGLFKMNASSGIEGITIYYKNQNLNNPKAQPWSIFYTVDMLFNIRNVTLINSYLGIGRSTKLTPHETLRIENVKGTVLKKGLAIHNSCDAGSVTGLYLLPRYWAKANLKAFGDNINNNSENNIISKIKEIGGIGIELTDAEQEHYANIVLSGFKYGIYVPDKSNINPRSVGSGLFYNLDISNCTIGIKIDDCTLVDSNHGYLISNGSIEGSEYAIYTASSNINKMGGIKLNDVTVKGKVSGVATVIYNNTGNSYTLVPKDTNLTGKVNKANKYSNLNIYRNKKVTGTNFTYLSPGSTVDTINSKLESMSLNGGGVVYLKPGIYEINKTIIIPSNVELRGSSATSTRIFKGTVFKVTNAIGTENKVIKLVGSNLGVSGINIIYESNVNSLNKSASYTNNDYVIMANSSNNLFITNISIAGASRGILVNNCKNFTIENIMTGIIDNVYQINNSRDGLIMNTLQNATVIARNDFIEYNRYNDNMFKYIFPNTVEKLNQIVLNESNNIELLNIFAYGIKKSILSNNSNSIYAVNIGLDVDRKTILLESNNSNIMLINSLRMGTVNISGNSNVGVYNTVLPGEINGSDYLNNIFKISKKSIAPILKVDSLVVFNNLSKKEINYDYNGDGIVSCKSSNELYVKCNINNKKVVITPVKNTNGIVPITITASSGLYYSSISSNINIVIGNSSLSSKGDANGNGKVDAIDYILVRKYILKQTNLTADQVNRADTNSDGKLTSFDYISIKKTIINGVNSSVAKTCPTYYVGTATACYDNTAPIINNWTSTSLKNTTINASSATTTICNLGSDNGDGLKIIEYYTDCTGIRSANISNNCATITIDKCANGMLYYRLKDNYNYSALNSINNIGKYLLIGQMYNRFLHVGQQSSNDNLNVGYYVSNCTSMTACIKMLGEIAINERKNSSNTEYINYLYNGVLGHNPDNDGLNFWNNGLNNGTPRKNILESFMTSNEVKSIYSSWGYN